jgi:hypothetical protein
MLIAMRAAVLITGRRRPTRSASVPQPGPDITRNNEARPSTWPIEEALSPRSANQSGMNAPAAVTANTAAMN